MKKYTFPFLVLFALVSVLAAGSAIAAACPPHSSGSHSGGKQTSAPPSGSSSNKPPNQPGGSSSDKPPAPPSGSSSDKPPNQPDSSSNKPPNQPGGSSGQTDVEVTFYPDQGTMADGQQTHIGACAALTTEFPFGTKIQLFNPGNLNDAQYSCTIEDTGTGVCQNHIDVALPGEVQKAVDLGKKNMVLEKVGFDQHTADLAAANHPTGPGCSSGTNS